jgi:hypothetical protein
VESFVAFARTDLVFIPSRGQREGLTGSFAMIRLTDHRIVINISCRTLGITDYTIEVLAHEIGPHIFYSYKFTYDNATLLNRIRFALPGI